MALHGRGMVWHGIGMAWHGRVWHGMRRAWHGSNNKEIERHSIRVSVVNQKYACLANFPIR